MFGFSVTKLLVLVAIIAVVWYGFKYVSRRSELSARREARKPVRENPQASVDMERCAVCSAFVPNSAAKHCGREDCPYPA